MLKFQQVRKIWADSNVILLTDVQITVVIVTQKRWQYDLGETEDTWMDMVVNLSSINKAYHKRNGRIMFPSSHDITPEGKNRLLCFRKIIESG